MRLRKPTPSMAVAMTALTVSLGGTSYAAVQITGKDVRNGSITSADIKNQTIKKRDIGANGVGKTEIGAGAVGASEVRNGSLGPADFKAGALKAGPTGPAGPKGDKGDAGTGRWVLVNALGQIEAQSGGFSITSAYNLASNAQQPTPAGAVGNVYIDANEDLTDNGIVATIALQNNDDQGGGPLTNGREAGADANPEFSGEITATRCQITSTVACAPTLAQNTENFVVSPRNSDGSFTDGPAAPANADDIGTRKRFYVIITGDSTDFVAP